MNSTHIKPTTWDDAVNYHLGEESTACTLAEKIRHNTLAMRAVRKCHAAKARQADRFARYRLVKAS